MRRYLWKRKKCFTFRPAAWIPRSVSAPFILASTAAAMGMDATIYFLIKGVTVVKKGEAERIKLGEFPTLRQVMDQAVKAGVKIEVCEQSCMLLGLGRGGLRGRRR